MHQQIFETLLKKYERPVTVLDLGLTPATPLPKIKQYQDVTYVFLQKEKDKNQGLIEQCEVEQLKNIIILQKNLSCNDFLRLGKCEHFDIVIAPDIIDQNSKNWKETLLPILRLGDFVILTTSLKPGSCSLVELKDYLHTNFVEILEKKQSEQTVAYLLKTEKKSISLRTWIWPPPNQPNFKEFKQYKIISNFHEKNLVKKEEKEQIKSNWKRGINLITFKMLNGIYPTNSTLKKNIEKLSQKPFGEWGPHNMVIQGNNIIVIDQKKSQIPAKVLRAIVEKRLRGTINLIQEKNPKKFYTLFWDFFLKN